MSSGELAVRITAGLQGYEANRLRNSSAKTKPALQSTNIRYRGSRIFACLSRPRRNRYWTALAVSSSSRSTFLRVIGQCLDQEVFQGNRFALGNFFACSCERALHRRSYHSGLRALSCSHSLRIPPSKPQDWLSGYRMRRDGATQTKVPCTTRCRALTMLAFTTQLTMPPVEKKLSSILLTLRRK